MTNFSHRIRRQRWTLQAGSAGAAFALRQHLREDWQEVLLPAFEKAFDEEVGDENVLHIPRIELSLRVGRDEQIGASWSALIHEQLLRQLREVLQVQAGHRVQEEPTEWKQSTARQDRFQNLLHYLRSGSVTWAAAGLSATEVAAELEQTCRERWPELLRARPVPSLPFYFRLLQLLPAAEAREAMLESLGKVSFPAPASLLAILRSLLAPEQQYLSRHTRLQLAALFLSEAPAMPRDVIGPEFEHIVRRFLPFANPILDNLITSLATPGGANATADSACGTEAAATSETGLRTAGSSSTAAEIPGVSQEEKSPARKNAAIPDFDGTILRTENSAPTSGLDNPGVFQKKDLAAPNSQSAQSSLLNFAIEAEKEFVARTNQSAESSLLRSPTEKDFPLLVTHAGLILLHPFLPRFFASTGISETSSVELSPFNLPRAAALLHFLATGRDAVYEYDLVFIKVLLGVDPEGPLCVSEELLADADRPETEALLESAITHWRMLRNTSIAGFRSSFLERRALLRKEDDGWRMQVERQPFDVLLEHLPWNIGVVRLPWMKQPLYTEW